MPAATRRDSLDLFHDAMAARLETLEAALPATPGHLLAGVARDETFLEWLRADRFDALIRYILHEYERGGGRDHWSMLRVELEARRDLPRLHRLFQGLLPGRLHRFWLEHPHAMEGKAGNIAQAAKEKAEALDVMHEYFRVLHVLGETDAAARVQQDMLLLRDDQKPPLPPLDARPMTRERYWLLLAEARRGADACSVFAQRLHDALLACTAKDLKLFQKFFLEDAASLRLASLWDLAVLVRGGCADDCFDSFLAWIVAQGEAAVLAARLGPEALADAAPFDWDLQCEALWHAADRAHLARHDAPLPRVKGPRRDLQGSLCPEDQLPTRYPALWRRYGER